MNFKFENNRIVRMLFIACILTKEHKMSFYNDELSFQSPRSLYGFVKMKL